MRAVVPAGPGLSFFVAAACHSACRHALDCPAHCPGNCSGVCCGSRWCRVRPLQAPSPRAGSRQQLQLCFTGRRLRCIVTRCCIVTRRVRPLQAPGPRVLEAGREDCLRPQAQEPGADCQGGCRTAAPGWPGCCTWLVGSEVWQCWVGRRPRPEVKEPPTLVFCT